MALLFIAIIAIVAAFAHLHGKLDGLRDREQRLADSVREFERRSN